MSVEDTERSESVCDTADLCSRLLLNAAEDRGHWVGRLSSSALSTATAVMAVTLYQRTDRSPLPDSRSSELVDGGLQWLRQNQNPDGGWGDTDLSVSNISTSMLCHAVFHLHASAAGSSDVLRRAEKYISDAGGVEAVLQRYGKDRTFSIPILTHCALAGTVDWKHVLPLPFELACLPAELYSVLRLPVVSYALPALIAIGQVVHHHRRHWNPLQRWLRQAAIGPSLKVLQRIQPQNGGFLEATPLTSFVCMSLVSCGHADSEVARRCIAFIDDSVREDGSWPIDTNLSTWVTTLSVNALSKGASKAPTIARAHRESLIDWLLKQQWMTKHPYTNADPGGWSWTNLPGAVPDADDTPGAMLALLNLHSADDALPDNVAGSLVASSRWLLSLQNRDGGIPTFCRGWGTMPFDRSSCDLTAHTIRAWHAFRGRLPSAETSLHQQITRAISRGMRFLDRQQRDDGSWLPLWFGNQHAESEENPLYGTSRVLLAYAALKRTDDRSAQTGIRWLMENQNPDGGWSARHGIPSSVEETGLAMEVAAEFPEAQECLPAGVAWLANRLDQETVNQPSPIGFYFAKLWYYEDLYPLIFATSGLRSAATARDIEP